MYSERNKVIGSVLRRLRAQSGLTQTQLAERIRSDQSIISKIEKGQRAVSFIETWLYAEAVGSDVIILIRESYEALVNAGFDPQEPLEPRKRWDED